MRTIKFFILMLGMVSGVFVPYSINASDFNIQVTNMACESEPETPPEEPDPEEDCD